MNAGAWYLGSSRCARPRSLAALPVMSLIPLTPLSAALTAATLARNLFLVQRAHFPGLLELTGCCVDRQSRFQRGRDDWQGLSSGLAVIDRIRLRRDLGSWRFRVRGHRQHLSDGLKRGAESLQIYGF